MNRIYFIDNPWPNGHRIINFEWSAHFKYNDDGEKRDGLYFDFHLETADYYEEDAEEEEDADDEDADDWHAKIVWNNYHSCTLSSQEWDNKGFLVGSDENLFDWESLDGHEYKIDFLSEEEQENFDHELTAFDVYLLGHDASAFHIIKFTKLDVDSYKIDWQGKLAQAYVGDYEFKYDFHTVLSSVSFSGIDIPDEVTDEQAYALLARFVRNPALFELHHENEKRRFVYNK
jgi:hypothetical protein